MNHRIFTAQAGRQHVKSEHFITLSSTVHYSLQATPGEDLITPKIFTVTPTHRSDHVLPVEGTEEAKYPTLLIETHQGQPTRAPGQYHQADFLNTWTITSRGL